MVEPVADLSSYVGRERTKLVIVNLDVTHYDGIADLVIHDKVGEVLSRVSST